MPPTESRRVHNLEKTYESRIARLEELRGFITTAALVGFLLALADLAMLLQLSETVHSLAKK